MAAITRQVHGGSLDGEVTSRDEVFFTQQGEVYRLLGDGYHFEGHAAFRCDPTYGCGAWITPPAYDHRDRCPFCGAARRDRRAAAG